MTEKFLKIDFLTLKKFEIQKENLKSVPIARGGLCPNLNSLSLFLTELRQTEIRKQETSKYKHPSWVLTKHKQCN